MDSCPNFRNATISEPRIFSPQAGTQPQYTRIPAQDPPAVPPRPFAQSSMIPPQSYSMVGNGMYGGLSSMYGGNGGGYSGYGMSPYSYGGLGMSGFNRFGGMYGGRDPMDPESRFIQLAEESSRPAFQSIESLVMAIGNIAAMLDSTFFALTSSFRAILGVAANFGRLRGVFSQFWTTFAIFRGITYLYRKALYLMGMTKTDPATGGFNEIFSAATKGIETRPGELPNGANKRPSFWPILTFLGFIFATPYLLMKLIGQVSTAAIEESKNPATWVNPKIVEASFEFKASTPHELSLRAGQRVIVAPREVQQTQKLMNTGWALASIDNRTSGLVPINYVQRVPEALSNPLQSFDAPATEPIKPSTDEPFESQLSQAIDIAPLDKVQEPNNDKRGLEDQTVHSFIANEIKDV